MRRSPCAYGCLVSAQQEGRRGRGLGPILIYTGMRVGLFFAFWLVLQLLTPVRGLWAVAVAIIGSGVVSFFLLNRQRKAMSDVVGGFFGRINRRIDEASRGEDDPDDEPEAQPAGVDRDQNPGAGQGRDEIASDGAADDDPNRSDGPRDARQPD